VNNGPFLSGAVAMYFLQTELGGSDVCTMWPNTGQSLAPLDNLTAVVGSMTGHRLRKALLWSGGDLTPIVSGAKQNACKAVILGGSEATYVSTMRTAGDQGMTDGSVVWLGMTTGYTRNVATAVGQVSGYWTNSEFLPWCLDDPALQEFKDLQEDAGFTLDSTAEGGYLAAKLFVTALRSIDGPVDRESVGKAMSSMKDVPTDGLTAQPFSWGRYNTSSQFLQLKDGRWEPHGGAQGAWYTLPATDDQVRSILTTR
jgi:branched-chain amino acid transport system substrate-binding protein